jgi:hypothetical protein
LTHDHQPRHDAATASEPGCDKTAAGRRADGQQEHAAADELAELLAQVVPQDGGFRHRQHIHLAYLTVRRHGTTEAAARIGQWIRQIAAYERAPQKYNATVTRAWTEIVGHHVAADLAGGAAEAGLAAAGAAGAGFEDFAARHPALLDKRLLTRHYSPSVLASAPARTGWVEPDRIPFPWRSRSG